MMIRMPSLLYRALWLLMICGVPYTLVLAFDFITHPLAPDFFSQSVFFRLIMGFFVTPFTIVIGYLIVRRERGNVIGPMLVLWGMCVATWAVRNDIEIATMAVLANAASIGWQILCVIGLYFPTGRIAPARLNTPISWLALFGIIAPLLLLFTQPELSVLFQWHTNPLFVSVLQSFHSVIVLFGAMALILLPFAVYSIYLRYKHANQHERRQIKWLTFAILTLIVVTPITLAVQQKRNVIEEIIYALTYGWIYSFPAVCIGNAILRHKLYDIDIIIRRTLIYTVLTGILAFVYFGGIIITQQLFQLATGEVPDFAIVLSTLLIAALFSPLRRRVQDTIDRRLYRRKYDVEQTLADFQKNLREDVDMETLKANLIGVVSDTMQPTSVRLWIAPSAIGNNTPNSSSP